jgi:hypothetical protein
MPKSLMQSVVSELQKERKRLEDELHRVTAALTAFGTVYMRGRKSTAKKRTISAAGRKRIAAAQKARWARVRAAKKRG